MDEFQRGYEKALKEITERLKVKGINIEEVLNEMKHERTVFTKPTILFTKLNKKGDLEFDNDKTTYYANHPEELEQYLSGKKQKKPQKGGSANLIVIDSSDPRFKKTLESLVANKTDEMCSAENTLIFQDFGKIIEGHPPKYLNALANQLTALTQTPLGYKTVCETLGEDSEEDGVISRVVEKCVNGEFLFVVEK